MCVCVQRLCCTAVLTLSDASYPTERTELMFCEFSPRRNTQSSVFHFTSRNALERGLLTAGFMLCFLVKKKKRESRRQNVGRGRGLIFPTRKIMRARRADNSTRLGTTRTKQLRVVRMLILLYPLFALFPGAPLAGRRIPWAAA